MDSFWSLEYTHDSELAVDEYDLRTPHELVRRALDRWSEPGDCVLDPFAGYGTTLSVAESMDREPIGVEYELERVNYARGQLDNPTRIRQGDLRTIDLNSLGRCDCCFTSPPFMEQTDSRNPFENYGGTSSYDSYLDDIETIFERLRSAFVPGARVILDIVNMKHEGRVTTLAWDVADRLSNHYTFDGEQVVVWEGSGDATDGRYGYGFDHSYCLVFSVPE